MKSLLLAFILFVICRVEASPIAQTTLDPNCAQGQEYWCQNIAIAKSCNAVEYCNQLIWNVQTKLDDDKKQCKICLKLRQILREKLKSDSSREYLNNVLKPICDIIRFESVKEACNNHVDHFIPQLLSALYKYLDPQIECGAECDQIEDFELTKSNAQKGIHQLIRDDEFIPQINSIDVEKEDIPCALCTELFTNVKKTINKTSKAEFKIILKGICKNVQMFKSECLDWFDKHSDEIYNIINTFEPESACLQIGLCPKKAMQYDSNEEIAMGNWNNYDDIIDLLIPSNFEYNDVVRPGQDYDLGKGVSSIECSLCEKVMDKVQNEIMRDKSREHIKNALNHACHIVHERSFRKKCEKFIERDGDKIIDLIIKGEASKLICSAIGFCVAEKQELNEIQMSPVECLECQHILKGVEVKVGNDRSKEHVEAVLQEQCSTIPNPDMKKKCFDFVQEHKDYIVTSLMNNQPPKQICKGLKFCSTRPTEKIVSQMMEKYSDTPQCVVCQVIAVNLDDLLRKNSTIDEIDHAVHTVCKHVPKKYSAKCEEFVENYAELAISYLLSSTPKQLCLGLNFCRAYVKKDTSHRDILECGVCNTVVDAMATVYSHDGSKEMDIVSETTCNLIPKKHQKQCIEIMEIYGVSLSILLNKSEKRSEVCGKIGKCFVDGDDSLFHEIKEAISNTENHVNSAKSHQIYEINESNDLKELIDIFNVDDTPKYITSEISEVKPLLGAKKCTFGPKYWCSSKETMDECDARAFCKKYTMLFFSLN